MEGGKEDREQLPHGMLYSALFRDQIDHEDAGQWDLSQPHFGPNGGSNQFGQIPSNAFAPYQPGTSSDLAPLPTSDFETYQGTSNSHFAHLLPNELYGYGPYLADPSFQIVPREINSSVNVEANIFPAQQYQWEQLQEQQHEQHYNQLQQHQLQQRHNQEQHLQRRQLEHQNQLQLYLQAHPELQQQQQLQNPQQLQASAKIGQLDTSSAAHYLGPIQNAVTERQMSGSNPNQIMPYHGGQFPFQLHQRGLSRLQQESQREHHGPIGTGEILYYIVA
jgi:hypothetical protein